MSRDLAVDFSIFVQLCVFFSSDIYAAFFFLNIKV